MAKDSPVDGDSTPSNVTAPRPVQKRKREPTRSASNKSARTSTPNAYARRSPPREARPISSDEDEDAREKRAPARRRSPSGSPPRPLKRPGAGARFAREQAQKAEELRKAREEAERQRVLARNISGAELVAEHYNAVPERGREWRRTDSQIKGLRSLNNWIKSTLIQKFSRPENMAMVGPGGLLVLDMACGKGGDLGKWEKAPMVPGLYVGCDIADVSISQAKDRYQESLRRNRGGGRGRGGYGGGGRRPQMEAQFYVQDTFGQSLGNIGVIRQVGFNPNAGPGPGVIQGGMASGGFDVVSMMFALHYSFENERLARGMLANVAGALKKGGRFIGVMPNSDVISARVKQTLHAEAPGATQADKHATPRENGAAKEDGEADEDYWDPEKPADGGPTTTHGEADDDDWDPEKPSDPQNTNGSAAENEDDWDPEKPAEATPPTDSAANTNGQSTSTQPSDIPDPNAPPLTWGNSIYSVSFPRHQRPSSGPPDPANPPPLKPLPRDGIFRPPYGWKYHYSLEEAVNAPEYVVPWEGFRALAEDYGLELLYRKSFGEVLQDEALGPTAEREMVMLAERMGVISRDRSEGRSVGGVGGVLVSEEEMEAAGFYHAFVFYKT